MDKHFQAFMVDDSGATAIEYGLIAMVVSVGIIVSLQLFASSLSNLWTYVATTIVGSL